MPPKKRESEEISAIFTSLRGGDPLAPTTPKIIAREKTKKSKKSKKPKERKETMKTFSEGPLTLNIADEAFFDVRGEKSANGPRKVIDGGFKVYTEEELDEAIPKKKRKNAGRTPLCPFDCDCCF